MLAEKENKQIKRAMNTLDFISEDPKERERHNSIIMAEYNRLTSEHNFFEAGVKEGIEKGIEKGFQEGKKNNQLMIVQNMLNKGFDKETIIEITGITLDELNFLIK